ncbi:hypothetical protein ACFWZ3_02610 [Frateuria sp. GZRR35]|uniref:hypothetical protein n=1 Tax=unclassified Frateuria TaxID=2648894 RepID=UPI003EDC6F2A
MSDSIELLETIGKNSALRHASAEELASTLESAKASDAFKEAVMSGDSSRLAAELGQKPLQVDHATQTPAHEEEDPADDDVGELERVPDSSNAG